MQPPQRGAEPCMFPDPPGNTAGHLKLPKCFCLSRNVLSWTSSEYRLCVCGIRKAWGLQLSGECSLCSGTSGVYPNCKGITNFPLDLRQEGAELLAAVCGRAGFSRSSWLVRALSSLCRRVAMILLQLMDNLWRQIKHRLYKNQLLQHSVTQHFGIAHLGVLGYLIRDTLGNYWILKNASIRLGRQCKSENRRNHLLSLKADNCQVCVSMYTCMC